jgi:hypothetical protein
MAKILSVLERTGANSGKAYYIITCEGMDKQIISWNKLAIGSDVNPDNLVLNDRGDSYKFKSGTDGKSWQDKKASYQKNDDLIIAQVAYKGLIDLVIAGKLNYDDHITESMIIRHGTMIKKAAEIIRIMADPAYAPPAAAPSAPSAPSGPPPPAGTTPPAPVAEFNLDEVLACDWATFDKKNYDQALAGVAKHRNMSGASAKAFLIDKFGIESSSMIPIAKRNEVIAALSKVS